MKATLQLSAAIIALCALPSCVVVNNPRPHHQPPPPGQPAAQPATPAAQPAAPAAPPAQPPFADTPQPSEAPPEPTKKMAEGRPPGLKPGAPEAYYIWHDGGGWHVRTTTARQTHRFQGRVWGLRGAVGNVKMVRLEHNDRFKQQGNSMSFDFSTSGHEDGFDFQIAEGDCALFYTVIDGKSRPERVFIGAGEKSPSGKVFKLCHD